jgi:hypothetical protein
MTGVAIQRLYADKVTGATIMMVRPKSCCLAASAA